MSFPSPMSWENTTESSSVLNMKEHCKLKLLPGARYTFSGVLVPAEHKNIRNFVSWLILCW